MFLDKPFHHFGNSEFTEEQFAKGTASWNNVKV